MIPILSRTLNVHSLHVKHIAGQLYYEHVNFQLTKLSWFKKYILLNFAGIPQTTPLYVGQCEGGVVWYEPNFCRWRGPTKTKTINTPWIFIHSEYVLPYRDKNACLPHRERIHHCRNTSRSHQSWCTHVHTHPYQCYTHWYLHQEKKGIFVRSQLYLDNVCTNFVTRGYFALFPKGC